MKLRLATPALVLMAALAAAIPFVAANGAQEKSAFTDAQKLEMKTLVRQYLLENPEVLTEVVTALQTKQAAAQAEKQKQLVATHRAELLASPEGTIIGNPKGDVTMVEFFDYSCGYCKAMFPAMMEVLKEDGNIKLVLKEFPILGPASETATRAALASRAQGKYTPYHLAMLGHKGTMTDELVMEIAKDVGLDTKKLEADMKDPAIYEVIDRNQALARDMQVQGTPALLVGDAFISGAIPKEDLLKLVADARAAKKK